MKVVFIAGPFNRGGTDTARRQNVEIAKQFANALAKHNIGFYCPHLHTMQLILSEDAPSNDSFFRDLNRHYFEKICSAVLALPNWESSGGATKEINQAKELGWPIFKPPSPDKIQDIIKWAKS